MTTSKKIILFHGSDHIIKQPVFGYGKSDNDYGKGFYCTKIKELASEWSCQNNKDGFVNSYELDTSGLNILYLGSKKFSILNWLTLLLENRKIDTADNEESLSFLVKNYHIDTVGYDLITGWRADDSYFTFAKNFLNNGISIQTLERAMKLGHLGVQIMLKSRKAFERVKFLDAERIDREIFYQKFTDRDANARTSYRQIRKEQSMKQGIFLAEIIKNPQVLKLYEKSKEDKAKSPDDNF